jgi:NDP-sugar pyrophosphorylase family protein
MKAFKPLLEIDGKTLIENAVSLFRDTGLEEIFTVVGYRADILIPVLEAASSRFVVNENYQNGMFSSIQKGAAELKNSSPLYSCALSFSSSSGVMVQNGLPFLVSRTFSEKKSPFLILEAMKTSFPSISAQEPLILS